MRLLMMNHPSTIMSEFSFVKRGISKCTHHSLGVGESRRSFNVRIRG